MTIAEIKSLAAGAGYGGIKATRKDDVIAEFLARQGGGAV